MKYSLKYIVMLCCLVFQASIARADDMPSSGDGHEKHHPGKKGMMQSEPTAEMRKKMAWMHQKMADCLNSVKPMKECKKEMMEDCPMMKDKGHCSMMDEMSGM